MITKLSVSNFKSVRQLDIECKKVNLFIGEPNTGKSNILEALGIVSWSGDLEHNLLDYIRLERVQNLFYDQLLDQDIVVKASTTDTSYPKLDVTLRHHKSEFQFLEGGEPFRVVTDEGKMGEPLLIPMPTKRARIKLFRFKTLDRCDNSQSDSLRPPNGDNLFSVVNSSKTLRETMIEFFRKYGLKLVARSHERTFELQKEIDGWVSTIPYTLASDTLRRIIFYTVAIVSNKDSVLVFEEPESNAFPYYTKYLGERIALDQSNQFFIATHNPYLLSAVIEKARKEDIQVFITYFKDFQTRVVPLTPDQVAELMEADPFFNLDRFIEAEE
jgi:AAA15 family ATPase/GTPase